uniref:H-2 class II histocompatibility antigen, E-S beta chain-like n=1 Tax=Seriola dumerili TaxID=41447 RepID=A0A3B4VH21_SERDU
MLVCRVFDFYPKQIRVSWHRDGQEVSSDVTSTDELADGDWFYQVHSHLEYTPRSGEKISCVVEHASLKEPLVTDWDPSMPESERNKIAIGASGLILGLILSLAGFIYYRRKARGQKPVYTSLQSETSLHQFTPVYTSLHQFTVWNQFTSVYTSLQSETSLHQFTSVYSLKPVYTSL